MLPLWKFSLWRRKVRWMCNLHDRPFDWAFQILQQYHTFAWPKTREMTDIFLSTQFTFNPPSPLVRETYPVWPMKSLGRYASKKANCLLCPLNSLVEFLWPKWCPKPSNWTIWPCNQLLYMLKMLQIPACHRWQWKFTLQIIFHVFFNEIVVGWQHSISAAIEWSRYNRFLTGIT